MEINNLHRRENIISCTIDLLHERGIHGVSTKLLAKKLDISEGTIFKYFPKKKDLLLGVLDQFSLYDEDIFWTAQNKKSDSQEALLFYLDAYLTYYENYPAITVLMQIYDSFYGIPELEEKSKQIFFTRFNYMTQLIEISQADGKISKHIEPHTLAEILSATFRGICMRWRISNFNFSLYEEVMKTVKTLLDAFAA